MIGGAKRRAMAYTRRALSTALLVTGVALVFAGVNAAVGFSTIGVVASLAAVAGLLYAGAVWFGAPPGPKRPLDRILVFDQSLRLASGVDRGVPLASCFPDAVLRDLEACCSAALAGASGRFSCNRDGVRLEYEAVPVRSPDGLIVYGILMATAENARPARDAARL